MMLSTSNPVSALGRPSTTSTGRQTQRPTTKDGGKQAIWVPMLNSASKGKDLPEKQLLVLGGTPEQQREFLEQLNPEATRPRYGQDRQKRKPAPISNRYALGYTYHDVLDADQEDVLARLNVYMLSNPSSAFAPLLKPLFSPKTVKHMVVVTLLDWSDPFKWARQLRQWVRLLRSVILSLEDETKIAMEESMTDWKERRTGPDLSSSQSGEQNLSSGVALGPGQWDEGLGIPLSVVCIQSEKIESLERDHGWQDEQFDFLMQWLRCVLLKHGGSLVYTASFDANHVRTLLHSNLNIHSLLKRDVAKPNYLDRDKILIPPNWDSWGKMRVLREATDLEAISESWSIEIQQPPDEHSSVKVESPSSEPSAVAVFEGTLPNPQDRSTSFNQQPTEEKVTVPSVQEFLQSQHSILESLKAGDEKAPRAEVGVGNLSTAFASKLDDGEVNKNISNARMTEHIGPYQINVNGIDFDAEEATRRLRERETERTTTATTASRPEGNKGSGLSTPTKRPAVGGSTSETGEGGKASNEAMSAFFANLIKKDKRSAASGTVSPTRGSPAPERRLE